MDADGALRWLLNSSHLLPAASLPQAVDEAARLMGAQGAVMYVIDRDQRSLIPLDSEDRGPLLVDATLPGRVYKTITVLTSTVDDRPRMWVPILDGAERLGVLELLCEEADLDQTQEAQLFASLVAELLLSRNNYTDLYLQARTPRPLNLAAELLWRQLPPLTYATERFSISALLEPWTEVGGDAFDYSCDADVVHVAVLDGMGHGLGATLLSSVALAAYRRSRRSGSDLLRIAQDIDVALSSQFGDDSFVTAALATLDLRAGTLSLLTAGHPAPLLLREGKLLGPVDSSPGVPLGIGLRSDSVSVVPLQPGDMVLLYTDGVVEARSQDGDFFGIERLADFLVKEASAHQPPPETLRRLMRAVLEHQDTALQDDATCLLLEWVTGTQQQFDLPARS